MFRFQSEKKDAVWMMCVVDAIHVRVDTGALQQKRGEWSVVGRREGGKKAVSKGD
jgi:hypothetical protein